MNDLRCPACNKKIGEKLEGVFEALCIRCRRWITLERRDGVDKVAQAV